MDDPTTALAGHRVSVETPTLRKAPRDPSDGDFHGDQRQPGQGTYRKPQGKQPVMAMDTSTFYTAGGQGPTRDT